MSRVAQAWFLGRSSSGQLGTLPGRKPLGPTAVCWTLVDTLRAKLMDGLKVHGAFLAILDDTLLMAKNGHQRARVQFWKDYSGNAGRGKRIWGGISRGILGLIAPSQVWDSFFIGHSILCET